VQQQTPEGCIPQVRPNSQGVAGRLADRLGMTYHRSALLMRIRRLMVDYPTGATDSLGWLLDVANGRGLCIVSRSAAGNAANIPGEAILSNEELAAALCLLEHPNEVQPLRVTAQLISAAGVDRAQLERLIVCERIQPVLSSLAQQALKVDPEHSEWKWVAEVCGAPQRDTPLLHWTRLAEPVPGVLPVASGKWRLVA